MAIIRSLMKTEMITVKPDDSVAEAAGLMAQNQIGAVLVVEGGVMKGIVSERDVVTRVVAERKDPSATKVSEISTEAVVDVDVNTPVRK
ncbi:MAG: CBS domain-containing protein, partial [Myxococcales bacterium]|nr:CBS domain-containing protein [Myxococcales bacterium]